MSYTRNQYGFDGLPNPEIDPQFYDAVPLKRLLAWLIDVVIVTAFVLAVVFLTFGFGIFAFPFIWLVTNFAYRVLTIASRSATWGMQFAGIELRNARGNRFDIAEAATHTVLYYLLNMAMIGQVISAGMMLLTDKGQGFHDYVLGTTAINRPAD